MIVECKCYSNPLTTSELGKFAYDLLDIRANQDYKHAIGICLTNSTYGPGPKLISAAEDIAIAHFDHLSEDATVAFLLEDVIPWFVEPDKRLTGNLAFSGKTANFESSAALLYALGEFIEERYQGVIPRP